MKVEDVKSYKQIYKDIHIPYSAAEHKWVKTRDLLGEQDLPRPSYYRYMPYAYAVAGVVLLLSASLFVVQAAKPGDSLYGMKALTKQVYSEFTKPFTPEKNEATESAHIAPPTSVPSKKLALPSVTLNPTSRDEMHENSVATQHEHETDVKGAAVTRTPQITTSDHQNQSESHGSQSNESQGQGSNSQNSHDNNSDGGTSNNSHGNGKGDH